ncbi:unnamed protein product [Prorocentrum cordatum]|uniref:Uncharacterized protein n=1 Tax=Prorocentrum cordatum TaxID=2364126 RepID=A0ABN9W1T3_9DINO|nr:unnamed protein product [Polarella glacialis]
MTHAWPPTRLLEAATLQPVLKEARVAPAARRSCCQVTQGRLPPLGQCGALRQAATGFLSARGVAGEVKASQHSPAAPGGSSPATARGPPRNGMPPAVWGDIMACLLDWPAATAEWAAVASADGLSPRCAAGQEGAKLQADVHRLVVRVRQLGSQLGQASLERDAAAAVAQRLQSEAVSAAPRAWCSGEGEIEEFAAAEAGALRAQIDALQRERVGMRAEIAACRAELLKGQPALEDLRRRLFERFGETEGLRHGLLRLSERSGDCGGDTPTSGPRRARPGDAALLEELRVNTL